MGEDRQVEVVILEVDRLMLRTLEMEGLLCFQCPQVEDLSLPEPGFASCRIRARDLEPLVDDPRSGLMAAFRQGCIVGYAVYGRPALYRNLDALRFEFDDDALLVGALYANDDALRDNVDVDLLIAVMGFAAARDYETVQVLCRTGGQGVEARAEMVGASGFELTETVDGLCLAEIAVKDWDEADGQ